VGYRARLYRLGPLAGAQDLPLLFDSRSARRHPAVLHDAAEDQKIDRVTAQLTELLTNYGEIKALVIDGWNAAWSRLNYEEMPFLEIYNHVKQLQPNCLISDYNQGRFPAPALYYTDVKRRSSLKTV
jgi:alpha-L-fucosidase